MITDVLDVKESVHVGPSHHTPCSEQFHTLDQVTNSQKVSTALLPKRD